MAGAVAGTTDADGMVAAASLNGDAIGDCTTDTFVINGGLGAGSPVICGTNSGYHSKL